MDGKETVKKTWMKIGFGILFVAACFIAMYILMAFHGEVLMVAIAAVLLLISAFLFLNAVFSDKAKKWIPQEDEQDDVKEVLTSGGDGEFRLKIAKHMKEMESTQKELIDVLKNQNTLIQTQIENLEHEIYMLSEKQANQAKSIIKFNKENARQLAISERETLEYVMMELKKAIEDNAVSGTTAESVKDAASAEFTEQAVFEEPIAPAEFEAAPVLEEVAQEDLFEVSDLVGDDEETAPVMPEEAPEPVAEEPSLEELLAAEIPATEEIPVAEEIEIPDMPEDIDLSELFDIPELQDEPVAEVPVPEVVEEIPVPEVIEEAAPVAEEKPEEPVPAANPLEGLSSDPNAMMTPEDIAKLLASMGQ